jgi:hypothetical protein
MMEWLWRFAGRKAEAPKFDLEHAVGAYLLELPRCPSRVVIAGPRYDAKHYFGEIIANPQLLLPWAEHHAKAVWSLACQEQAARRTLPIWIRGADMSQVDAAYLPAPFFQVLDHYVDSLISSGVAVAHCTECDRDIPDPVMEQLNKRMDGLWHCWTAEWRCDQGHLIYRDDHELKFFCNHDHALGEHTKEELTPNSEINRPA